MKLREKLSEVSFSPMQSGEAVASRAVQYAGDGTRGPQQPHKPTGQGAERSKGGGQRLGGWELLGNLD